MQVKTSRDIDSSPVAPGVAAAVEEVAYTAPLIAHPAAAEDHDPEPRTGPWDAESPLDGVILRGLVHP